MRQKFRLAIVHTHPIQYNSPFFRRLAKSDVLQIKVFYTWSQSESGVFDKKFGRRIRWDIPLLEGYEYEFVKNVSPNPGSQSFFGVINPQLRKKIIFWKADGVLIYGWRHFSHLALMLQRKRDFRIFFRGDSTLLDSSSGIRHMLRLGFLRRIYSNVDAAFYVGSANKAYFRACGLEEDRLLFVPHSVENERFFDADGGLEIAAQKWRMSLGIERDELTFVYAGKFEPKKNLEFLVRVFKELKGRRFRLLLVGNGVLERKLKAIAAADKRVIFLPFQNQSKMPLVYRLGQVFVLPSAWGETWGLSVNEAMASGRAILVSNKVGCSADLVKNGMNGYIFRFDSEQDLLNKLRSFNTENVKKFGKKSLEIISKWTYDRGINNIEEYIRNLD